MTQYQTVTGTETVIRDGTIKLHGPAGFEGMRKAGRLAAEILDALAPMVQPGVTTGELDDVVRQMTLDGGAVPATLGYRGYTHSCCISINHVVCHGIPGDKALKDGDIVNIDVTPLLDGWHGDTSRMYLVGDVPLKAKKLVDVTHECLMIGIEQAKPGARLGDIGAAIQAHAEAHRYGVVREFCGHGLGRLFHDAPEVVHAAKAGTGPELRPGMFMTIEPMINLGRPWVKLLADGWTAVTRDKSLQRAVRTLDRHHRDGQRDLHAEPDGARQAALSITVIPAKAGSALGLAQPVIPAKAGIALRYRITSNKSSQRGFAILDQFDLPRTLPCFERLFARDRRRNVVVLFRINQRLDPVLSAERRTLALAMLSHPRGNIRCDADVEHAARLVGQDIDPAALLHRLTRWPAIPAFAGMTAGG